MKHFPYLKYNSYGHENLQVGVFDGALSFGVGPKSIGCREVLFSEHGSFYAFKSEAMFEY